MNNKWRDPLPEEINTPEFNAVWKCIRHWDIGLPWDIVEDGGQLYSGATGNHVVAILDALKQAGCLPRRDRLRIGTTVKQEFSNSENDISNAAWLLHLRQKRILPKIKDEELGKLLVLGRSHPAKLAEGKS